MPSRAVGSHLPSEAGALPGRAGPVVLLVELLFAVLVSGSALLSPPACSPVILRAIQKCRNAKIADGRWWF